VPWRRGAKLPFVRGSPNRLVHGQAKASSTRTASEASFCPRQKPVGVGTDCGQTGFLLWTLLVRGSAANLVANVTVAEPTATGRISAAWPSLSAIAMYEFLMRKVHEAACACVRKTWP
jgi:hypothetical protein